MILYMKATITRTLFAAFAMLAMMGGCKRDDLQVTSGSGTAPTLTATNTTLVLSSDKATTEAVAFSWNKADYKYNAAVQYTLQLDKEGNNFAAPKEYAIEASAADQKLNVADLNNALALMGLAAGTPTGVEARVKAELLANVNT
ncbi:MAG: hypothetical protein EOP54_24375, partial [Sphingobacteriales bacterium]